MALMDQHGCDLLITALTDWVCSGPLMACVRMHNWKETSILIFLFRKAKEGMERDFNCPHHADFFRLQCVNHCAHFQFGSVTMRDWCIRRTVRVLSRCHFLSLALGHWLRSSHVNY